LSKKSKSGVLAQPVGEGWFVSSRETLLWVPMDMEFIVLVHFGPDERMP
jgi:hypothetical protein